MPSRFDLLSARLREAWKPHKQATTARSFHCSCGRPIFFRNTRCLACGAWLGYEPEQGELVVLEPAGAGNHWRIAARGDGQLYSRCANFFTAASCNWLVPASGNTEADDRLCRACCLNRFIPDLSNDEYARLWGRIEISKRRLVSQLIGLGLPVRSKVDEDPEHGLAFDFLAQVPGAAPVMTGHAGGIITLNIAEADAPVRERLREDLHEPYRTVLGHLRHEVGHYYWDRLVRDTALVEPFRELFGDERADYAAALRANYEQGPPPHWPTRFVSSYASTHPWEDWAETWAHYLHMMDTVDTALSLGIDADNIDLDPQTWDLDALWRPDDPGAQACLGFLNAWVELTAAMNEMSRSMGQPDFYPFVLPRAAVAKLQFIHLVVHGRAGAPPEHRP